MQSQFRTARNLKKKDLEDRKAEFVRIRDYAGAEIGKIEARIKVIEDEDSKEEIKEQIKAAEKKRVEQQEKKETSLMEKMFRGSALDFLKSVVQT